MPPRLAASSRFDAHALPEAAVHVAKGIAFAALLVACSLDDLADGTPASSSSDTSASATTGGGLGGAGGGGGAPPSVFTWVETFPAPKDQPASDVYRPALAAYKDGFVVLFTREGVDAASVLTIVRAYRRKANGPGFEVDWENTLIERFGDVVIGSVRGKRTLAVAENGDVAVAGTYRKRIALDAEDDLLFDDFPPETTDAAAIAGFYLVLRHQPGRPAADKVDAGRTKRGTYINAAVFDAANDLVVAGAVPKDAMATEPLFPCNGVPATAAVSGFVATRPKKTTCKVALFTPVNAVSEGVFALARQGDGVHAAGVFGPSSGTIKIGATSYTRNGNGGSDVFAAELAATTLAVRSATTFGRSGSSEAVIDLVANEDGVWLSGVGGTNGCAQATSDAAVKHFLVSLAGGTCTEALASAPAAAALPAIRSVVPFRIPSGEERLWIAGDSTASTFCGESGESPDARNGYWLEATHGGPDAALTPLAGQLFAAESDLFVARVLRLADGVAIIAGSYTSPFDVLPAPNLNDLFVAALPPSPALACTPATGP